MNSVALLFRNSLVAGAIASGMVLAIAEAEVAQAAQPDTVEAVLSVARSDDDGLYVDLTGGSKGNGNNNNEDSSGSGSSHDSKSASSNNNSSNSANSGSNSSGGNGTDSSGSKNSSGSNTGGPGGKPHQEIPFAPMALAYPALGAATFAAAYGVRRIRSQR